MDTNGIEWIDDPNERLRRGAALPNEETEQRERDRFAEIAYRDSVWRPYLNAGAPYGDDDDGARRWYREREDLHVPPIPKETSGEAYRMAPSFLRSLIAGITLDDALSMLQNSIFVQLMGTPTYRQMSTPNRLADQPMGILNASIDQMKEESDLLNIAALGLDAARAREIARAVVEAGYASPRPNITTHAVLEHMAYLLSSGTDHESLEAELIAYFVPTYASANVDIQIINRLYYGMDWSAGASTNDLGGYPEPRADPADWVDPLANLVRGDTALMWTPVPVPAPRHARVSCRSPPTW